jgi:hypothetical protein
MRPHRDWALRMLLIALPALAIAVPGEAVRAQAPRWTLTDFPRHPGEIQVPFLHFEDPEGCLTEYCRELIVGHPIEEVFRYYQQRLSPRESDVTYIASGQDLMAKAQALNTADNRYDEARDRLKPGEATPVFLLLSTSTYASPDLPADIQQTQRHRAGRAPYRAGEWLAQANFKWAYKGPSGELMQLSLGVADVLAPGPPGDHATNIRFSVSRQDPEPPAPAELTEPSARELGVPAYPGARFNASNSSSGENGREYVYDSDDPPDRVIRFYETRLGKRAVTAPDTSTLLPGSQLIVLQGTPADPKEAVAVMHGGIGTWSVITIRKPPR